MRIRRADLAHLTRALLARLPRPVAVRLAAEVLATDERERERLLIAAWLRAEVLRNGPCGGSR